MSYIKHIFTLAASAALTLFMGACSDDVDMPSPEVNPGDGYITISLSNARAGSRAGTEADVDNLNENKIESVILALYPSANPSDKAVYLETFDFTDTNTSTTLKVRLTNEIRDRLFPTGSGSICSAFVIVNKPADSPAITEEMTVSEMQRIAVSADFANRQGQNSFVMDGSTANITYRTQGAREWAEGSIEVRRVASKISLAVKVADDVEVDGVKWTPDVDRIKVLIRNGVKNSQLNPSEFTPGAADYYSTSLSDRNEDYRERTFSDTGGDYPYALTSPFYTFPNSWGVADEHATTMTLMVPWKKQGANTYETCYYTVPVTKGNSIGRNISYSVKINVNMLGSFTPDDPFELENLSYYAVEWGSVDIDVDINDIRYLVVDQNAFTMNNEQLLNIPVYTSHPVTVKSVVLKYYRYNTTAQGKEREITITPEIEKETENKNSGKGIYTCTYNTRDDGSSYVAYDHPLKLWTPYNSSNRTVSLTGHGSESAATTAINSIAYYRSSTDDAYSRYIAEVTIVHTDKIGEADESLYTETLTITQYPQIYITSTENFYYQQNNNPVSPTFGNMFCNANNTAAYENDGWTITYYWYAAAGLYTNNPASTNANSNQYVINITQLNAGADYIIGDPRTSTYTDMNGWKNNFGNNGQNAPNNNWASAPALYYGPNDGNRNRRLKYYYPSDESDNKERWIAPAFRIASSYGVCWPMTYNEAKARCAGYQELGYPAGRWRIPTVAEIEYIMKLSQESKIPTLFNTNSKYMSAQGVVETTFNSEGKLTSPDKTASSAVRCVYDEWYWNDVLTTTQTQTAPDGTTIPKYTFTWGDRPR